MISMALYKREMKGSIKLLIIFGAIITLYVSIIINMYDPQMMKTLDSFVEAMPELMASVGMKAAAANLLGFMVSYLYGFILLIFPMLFCILRGNALIAKYVDKGSMASLVAAPVKRSVIAFTQMKVLVSGTFLLVFYATLVELIWAIVSAFVYWRNMFSFFLHIFGYEIQHCIRSGDSSVYVCIADACKCWRGCGKSKVFYFFYSVQSRWHHCRRRQCGSWHICSFGRSRSFVCIGNYGV